MPPDENDIYALYDAAANHNQWLALVQFGLSALEPHIADEVIKRESIKRGMDSAEILREIQLLQSK